METCLFDFLFQCVDYSVALFPLWAVEGAPEFSNQPASLCIGIACDVIGGEVGALMFSDSFMDASEEHVWPPHSGLLFGCFRYQGGVLIVRILSPCL